MMTYSRGHYNEHIIYDPFIVFMTDSFDDSGEKKRKTISVSADKSGKTLNIILADDDEDDRELFAEALDESGFNVKLMLAESGKTLIEMLRNLASIPDMIFLDLNMPHLTGFECLKEIRNNLRFQKIPIIIYSTSSSPKDIDETFDKGANLYLRKPNSFRDLKQMTRQVLDLDWNIYKPYSSRKQFLFSFKANN